jgi:hypothetical protein
MVRSLEHIGLSNVVSDRATIVHSTVIGRRSYGRVADLLSAWFENEAGTESVAAPPLRLLILSLLESFPKRPKSTTWIEMSVFQGQLLLGVRAECGIEVDPSSVERSFTQYWLNSEEIQFFKKTLHPADQIEVRYQNKTGLMEWRVCRPLSGKIDLQEAGGFLVFSDSRDEFVQPNSRYRDLGDTPYKKWLEEVYETANREASSGEIRIHSDTTQTEVELAKIKLSEVVSGIEEMARQQVPDSDPASELERMKIERSALIEVLQEKEVKILRRRAEDTGANPFREKAIEMYQKLRAVQMDNEELEATLRRLRNEKETESTTFILEGETDSNSGIRHSTEDLQKRVERLQRSLESEKAKVGGLLDRALAAEREAQASAPIISDLEGKVEYQLKTSLQYKKEIDNLKLKVVQAEAEKNKVKNELLKAQSQIQTLNKRLAG